MAKRRNRKRPGNSSGPKAIARGSSAKLKLPQAALLIGFSEDEEAFFRAGESEPHLEQLAELEPSERERPSLWRRLFARGTSSLPSA